MSSTVRPVRRTKILALATALVGSALVVHTESNAQSASDFMPNLTIIELMESMVMPSAQIVWDAVVYVVSVDGDTVKGPETDEDWQKLRWAAVTLAESANNLVVAGRKANKPGAEAGEGELAPAEIDALIASERPAWVAHAHVLYDTAIQAIAAIDARDADKISEVGGDIDAACESCHLQFWYPNQ